MTEVTASAPGRVNLIGEHTDYNEGFVLPTVIPQRTFAALRRRADDRVFVESRELGRSAEYRIGHEQPQGDWMDYIQGCTAKLVERGHTVGGFELHVSSDVPLGSGLSSSAALELAVLRVLRETFDLPLDDLALALLGQRVENEFVGAPTGAMDQLAASLGQPGSALFIDTRDLTVTTVALPDADLIVISSGLAHDHASGDYRTRRAECEEAARRLGVRSLRDVSEDALDRVAALPDPLARRARHVVTENARVLAAVEAIRTGALDRLGALFRASHDSMRDDFEVSLRAIDQLVELANADEAVHGARLTGGGFGGSIVALARAGGGRDAAARIARSYARATGNTPEVLVGGALR